MNQFSASIAYGISWSLEIAAADQQAGDSAEWLGRASIVFACAHVHLVEVVRRSCEVGYSRAVSGRVGPPVVAIMSEDAVQRESARGSRVGQCKDLGEVVVGRNSDVVELGD